MFAVREVVGFHFSKQDIDRALGNPNQHIIFKLKGGGEVRLKLEAAVPSPTRGDLWLLAGLSTQQWKTRTVELFYTALVPLAYGRAKQSLGTGRLRRKTKRERKELLALLDPTKNSTKKHSPVDR